MGVIERTARSNPLMLFKISGNDRKFHLDPGICKLTDHTALTLNPFIPLKDASDAPGDTVILSLSPNYDWITESLEITHADPSSLFQNYELPVSGIIKACRNVILMGLRAPEFLSKRIIEHQLITIYKFAIAMNGVSVRTRIGPNTAIRDTRILAVIAKLNETRGQGMDTNVLASTGGLSRSQMFAEFKNAIGLPPLQYANALRIEHAVELLSDKDIPISEVAFQLGYSSQANFSRFMKRHTGMSPGRFRRACIIL